MDELDRWATGRLLSAAARLVEHEWNTHLAQWDLNHASLAVLHVLLAGPQTQRELAAAVQVEDQTMSRTVERLERSGYVERHRDHADRRRIVVSLTPSGRSTCHRASDVQVAEGFFAGGVDDVPALRQALAGIIRHLSSQRWPGPPAGHGPPADVEPVDVDPTDVDPADVDPADVDARAPAAEGDASAVHVG
jgi:DNA-binding MarR family transcriptional regulator